MTARLTALLLILAWPSSAHAQAQPAPPPAGLVAPGMRAQVVTVEITNESATLPIEPELKVVSPPPWIANLRIVPDASGPLPPQRTRRFIVTFDVAADAPAGALASLKFEVSAPGGEQFDNPAPEIPVRVLDTRLYLSSVSVGASRAGETSATGSSGRKQGEWMLQPFVAGAFFSGRAAKATWLLTGAPRLPPVIRLGEDFRIGICGGVALRNDGGDAPRAQDRLQHKTLLGAWSNYHANQARSYQQFSLPPGAGEEARMAQEAEIVFRYDPSRSAPPARFVYVAEARQAGQNQDRSILASREDLVDPNFLMSYQCCPN